MEPIIYRENLVVQTKLAPPRPYWHTLWRQRLTDRLLEVVDYRLAVVQAGTGYGKTTALSTAATSLAQLGHTVIWYHLDAEDAEPLVFLLHLLHGFTSSLTGLSEAPLAMLERWEHEAFPWTRVVDSLVNELAAAAPPGGWRTSPLFLVLDDVHHIQESSESLRILDRFIGQALPHLHPILSTRYPLDLPGLVNWRVRGEVLEIGQAELAFTPEEIGLLFREQFGLSLAPDQVALLFERTEGWPIALSAAAPLVRQRLEPDQPAPLGATGSASTAPSLSEALGQISGSTSDLFLYLAKEVLALQPADIREFLQLTSTLRTMTKAICDCIRSANDSDQILRHLLDTGLFVVDLGDGHVRYHRLFRDLLSNQLGVKAARATHLKAAACYKNLGEDEEALYHLLAAGEVHEAARVLNRIGKGLVRAGRLNTLAGWIGTLPPEVLERYPALMTFLGDIARLQSRFGEALGWYEQAEARSRAVGNLSAVGQALRGQARVYLDTVDPSRAEHLLQEALRLSDGQDDRESRARLLDLLAENLLNRGQMEEAEKYRAQARDLREGGPGEAEVSVRLMLRTGRLDEARRLLEERAAAERQDPVPRPRAHRETLLLLSLVLAFQGQQGEAYECAVEGTERGQVLQSHFITAVGHMRQGHAWLLQKDVEGYEAANQCFEKAISLSKELEVPRLKVEAYWGQCQAHGFRGDLAMARRVADLGIDLAQAAGDEWVAACIRLAMGASYAMAEQFPDAISWLMRAGTAFRDCSDTHGEAAARLWQCLVWQQTRDTARLERDIDDVLRLAQEHNYHFLFLRRTLLGPPDQRALVPLLLFARTTGYRAAYAEGLLSQLGLSRLEIHPGYQLRVQTLGPFRVWRGSEEIGPGDWRRKKARQLFQLLLTHRHTLLDRDQIVDQLWPELSPEGAHRDLKIAFSTLYGVLEPKRSQNEASAFVIRDGTLYGLRSEADLQLDAQQFEELVSRGDALQNRDPAAAIQTYWQALDLYQGDYLQEYPYEEWSSQERERLLTLYLRTAERLALALVQQESWEETVEACQLILARDDCWEQAYRLMMLAYARLGNQAQALRTYQRCVEKLRRELNVEPATATTQLHESIR